MSSREAIVLISQKRDDVMTSLEITVGTTQRKSLEFVLMFSMTFNDDLSGGILTPPSPLTRRSYEK